MNNDDDLTGLKFGKLTVIEEIVVFETQKRKKLRCICDCGNEILSRKDSILSGKTKSCGCSQVKDLIGKTFGRLTVIEFCENRGNHNECLWLCKCCCGKEKIVTGTNLKSGNVKSCGCLKEESLSLIYSKRLIDLTGRKFGRLTVIKRVGNNIRGEVCWLCGCICGNTKIVIGDVLRRGGTNSCGCLASESVRAMSYKKPQT